MRNFADRADIGGDVSPSNPSPRVAACTSSPLLVAQRARQPVDLRLRRESEGRVILQAEKAAHAFDEFENFLVGEHVFSPSDSIGTACFALPNFWLDSAPTFFVSEVGRTQFRKACSISS